MHKRDLLAIAKFFKILFSVETKKIVSNEAFYWCTFFVVRFESVAVKIRFTSEKFIIKKSRSDRLMRLSSTTNYPTMASLQSID